MEQEIIEAVMSEVLSELRELKQQQTKQTKAVVIVLSMEYIVMMKITSPILTINRSLKWQSCFMN